MRGYALNVPMTPSIRSRAVSLIVVLLVLCSLSAVPATATPTGLDTLSIAIMYEESWFGDPTLLIVAETPADTPLPVQILLPLPDGGTVDAAWELPPDPGTEPSPAEWEITVAEGRPAIVLTLTGSRSGSVVVSYPDSRIATSGTNNMFEVGFSVVLPTAVEYLVSAIAIPDGVEVSQASGDPDFSVGPDGRRYFYTESGPMAAGDSVAFSASVLEGWVDEPQHWMLGVVGAILILAALALLIATRRRSG